MKKKFKPETDLAHYGEDRSQYHGAVVPPLFQNSLFTFDNWDDIDDAFNDRTGSYIYTRLSNPTVQVAEKKLAALAGGERAKLFASGMAAISGVVMHTVKSGDHILAVKNLYGPSINFLSRYLADKMNITTTFIAGVDTQEFENALQENTKLIYIESPSSSVFGLQDIEAVAHVAQKNGIVSMIDNTWATPVFQKPVEMGIDFEVHSCSKYIGGHSDIVAGAVIGTEDSVKSIQSNEYELLGGIISPFEAWLIIRSLRTLPMRMKQHQENAIKVAEYLQGHEKISQVNYPGLSSHPQYKLGKKQMTGYSGLMSFVLAVDNLEKIKTFANSLGLFNLGVSWGGHESLIYAPAISYMKELSPERFKEIGISAGFMRISVGLENVSDLIADLDQALKKL